MPKFGTKNALIGYFWARILKNIVIFEISIQTVNFSIGSTFSKGPGSAFSEGPGLGPGPLYKVCLLLLLVTLQLK